MKFAEEHVTGDSESDRLISEFPKKWHRNILLARVIGILARSEELTHERAGEQRIISDFLYRNLVAKRGARPEEHQKIEELHKYVSAREGGAALERAGRLTYALDYYEQWFPEAQNRVLHMSDEELRYLRARWLVCKRRLADVTRGTKGSRHREEIEDYERRWGLKVTDEPTFPSLSPFPVEPVPLVQPAEDKPVTGLGTQVNIEVNFEIKLSDRILKGELYRRKHRLTLRDIGKEDKVDCGPDRVSSGDLDVVKLHEAQWLIREWNILCELAKTNETVTIKLRDAESKELLFGIEV